MLQSCCPDLLGLKVGVGDLKCHADGERQVGEVGISRGVALVEVDAALWSRVVEPSVPTREYRVQRDPGKGNAAQAERALNIRGRRPRGASQEEEDDSTDTGHRGDRDSDVDGIPSGVLARRVRGGGLGIHRHNRRPHPDHERSRCRHPSDEHPVSPREQQADHQSDHDPSHGSDKEPGSRRRATALTLPRLDRGRVAGGSAMLIAYWSS